MEKQTINHKQYDFFRYEWRRMKSLFNFLLGKSEKQKVSSDERNLFDVVKEVLLEFKNCSPKLFCLLIFVSVLMGGLRSLSAVTRMLYIDMLPQLLDATTATIVFFVAFYLLEVLREYGHLCCINVNIIIKDAIKNNFINNHRARDYVDILNKPRSFFVTNGVEQVLSIASRIADRKSSILNDSTFVLVHGVNLFVSLVALFFVSPLLTIIILCAHGILVEFNLYNNHFYRALEERIRLFDMSVDRRVNTISGQPGLVQDACRIKGVSRYLYSCLCRKTNIFLKKERGRRVIEVSFDVIFNVLVSLFVVFFAIYDIIRTGDIGRFVLITTAVFNVTWAFGTLVSSVSRIINHKNKIIDAQKSLLMPKTLERKVGENTLSKNDNSVYFKNVRFSYPVVKRVEEKGYLDEIKRGEEVLHNISLKIEKGGITVIAGQSGQGKTTLVSLIRHDYDIDEGEIFIGNKNVQSLSDEAINQQIAFVNQKVAFFDDTILKNLTYNKPNATAEEIDLVLKAVGLDEDVAKFDKKLAHRIGINGAKLSGGQRQRLALARTLLTDRSIVIMDEPTTGLDQILSFKIMKALKKLAKTKTVILVTHNPTEIALADRVLIINDGQIISDGRPMELVETSNFLSSALTKQDILSKQKLFLKTL